LGSDVQGAETQKPQHSGCGFGCRFFLLYMANANVTHHYDKTRVDNQEKSNKFSRHIKRLGIIGNGC
jgi:hypothetical protein